MGFTLKRRKFQLDPRLQASRTTRVRALVLACAPPLWHKVRPQLLDELVRKVVDNSRVADEFVALSEVHQLFEIVKSSCVIIQGEWDEVRRRDAGFEQFSDVHFGLSSLDERRRWMSDYLEDTVQDKAQLREDKRALGRYLNYEALRERHQLAREKRLIFVELAMLALGRAVARMAAAADDESRSLLAALLSEARLDRFLGDALARGDRWQNQLATVDALAQLAAAVRRANLADTADPEALRVSIALCRDSGAHPWVQARAFEVLVALSSDEASSLIAARLMSPRLAGQHDFVVRRLIVDLIARDLRNEDGFHILDTLAAQGDPSEYVRMGLAEALSQFTSPRAPVVLRRLLGLDPGQLEPSARVRSSAVLGSARAARAAMDRRQPAQAVTWLSLIVEVLHRDDAPLVLEAACDEWTTLAEVAVAQSNDFPIEAVFAKFLGAFDALRLRQSHPAFIHEAAASAAEVTLMLLDPARRAWTSFLRGQLAPVAPGNSLDVRPPVALPALPADPLWLGRILALLSRNDWGLQASLKGGRIHLSRGDRFRPRAWRILHELKTPAPNKRQGFQHTLGRITRGELRAHPGKLDEVTATVVPGERVSVDIERGWGRHLPTVNDLLDLPLLRARPVFVLSSHGAMRVDAPGSLLRRLKNHLLVTLQYEHLARMRLRSLAGSEPRDRSHYLAQVKQRFGIDIVWLPYPDGHGNPQPISRHAAELKAPAQPPPTALSLAALPEMSEMIARAADWLHTHSYYFASHARNSQAALALMLGGLSAGWLGVAYKKRREIDRARQRIPLSIGGWGTRGKSGTERLKAGLFHGLGFQVFVKTTGCEAMFIHSSPGQTPQEIFIFRPYDKATIWEQAEMVKLGADVGAEVFLWECMALNPIYVDLLENDWMQDDLVTLTNAYPDHEDIQGPAGMDVARVIAGFIPKNSTLVTSEDNFLPLFRTVAAERNTALRAVYPRDGDLIAKDILDLFPYQEHPRNIALVARLAEELGIDPQLAIYLMSQWVVPDIGVLKTYPDVRVRGRVLRFINGCSANERNGTLSNWRRTACDRFDLSSEPERWVITVVNNRADRISRSEVFARLIVNDVAADRHVFIGTNLTGLHGYMRDALDRFVAELEVVTDSELEIGKGASPKAVERLTATLARARVPEPTVTALMTRLEVYARGAGLSISQDHYEVLVTLFSERLASARGDYSLEQQQREVANDQALTRSLSEALCHDTSTVSEAPPEVLEPATREEVLTHFLHLMARVLVHAGLRSVLDRGEARAQHINQLVGDRYRELYLDSVDVIADPSTTGDQIIDRCARGVPPGVDCTIMGMQNIKGTGLDFVYRWKALDQVTNLVARIQRGKPADRLAALRELECFEDHGLTDTGFARVSLVQVHTERLAPDEALLLERTLRRINETYRSRRAALEVRTQQDRMAKFLSWAEGGVDYLDSVRRYRESRQVVRDLAAQRIGLGRAVLEMRAIYTRQRGGWLSRLLLGGESG